MNEDEKTVIKVLMDNGLTEEKAKKRLEHLQRRVENGADPFKILRDLRLEPDYLFALL